MKEEMNNIKESRFKKNITQIELYKRTGIWPSRLSLIENSHIEASEGEKVRLARALGFKKDWLFSENE